MIGLFPDSMIMALTDKEWLKRLIKISARNCFEPPKVRSEKTSPFCGRTSSTRQ